MNASVKKNLPILIAFIPVVVLMILFFVSPIVITFIKSMGTVDGGSIGLARYVEVFSNPKFNDAFVYTLKVAVISTSVSLAIAVAVGMALRGTFVGKSITLFMYQMNISMPHIAMASMVMLLFSQTGMISAMGYHLGLIDNWYEFPRIVGGPSASGTIISYCLKFIPFIGMSVLAILQSSSMEYEDQSLSLGVGKARTFLHVTLPALKPALVSTGLIVFCYAFGGYEVPMLLGNSSTLSTMAYNAYYNPYDPSSIYDGYAVSLIIALITISFSAISLYVSSGRDKG